VYSVKY